MQTDKARILIVAFTDLGRDPRVYRQIHFLKEEYAVTAAGLGDPQIPGVRYIPIPGGRNAFWKRNWDRFLLKARCFERVYWSSRMVRAAADVLGEQEFDLILANDMFTLPFAVRLGCSRNAKVLLDAHEYFPRLFDRWMFRFFDQHYWDYICREYLPKIDGMVTVCKGIAEEYRRNYSVTCGVITNAPFQEECKPSSVDQEIRLIHHGTTTPSRRVENMIQLMDHLEERFTLELILVNSNPAYYRKLRDMSRSHDRIQWREPVAMVQIVETLNPYDVGLYLMPPTSFNQKMSLPNKLFEFIQARLAVAIWPSPEMARVVREHDCGVVADDFTLESMADLLNSLSRKDITRYKQNAHQAATVCCAETNRGILLQKVKQVLI
jgi:glycosyltransferase involved in cell wall biosynthesis